jgi:ubiquinone/menaquinone biosynthesis C-methylase UbiE
LPARAGTENATVLAGHIRTTEAMRRFDSLYAALAASPTHARIESEVLGERIPGLLGCAGATDLRRIAEVAGIGRGRRVLDLCSGSGGVATWYGLRMGASVVGVDCSAAGVAIGTAAASSATAVGVRFAVADASRLPFADASFDGLYCLDGFSEDFPSLVGEALRVLRPGSGFALLLNLPSDRVCEALETLRGAHAAGLHHEVCTNSAASLTARWLDAYQRQARAHVREVGADIHRGLVDELRSLLAGYESHTVERVLLAGHRPD